MHSTYAFSLKEAQEKLPFDIAETVQLEIQCTDQPLYNYVLKFVSKAVSDARSIRADMGKGGLRGDDDLEDVLGFVVIKGKGKSAGSARKRKREVQMPNAILGLGWHNFDFSYDEKQAKVVVLHQQIGEPVADPCGSPKIFSSLVLFIAGADQTPLLKICQEATEEATKQKENRVALWRFDTKMHYWMRIARRLTRSLESVVIEETQMKTLMSDVEWFVKDDTRAFYAKHGIPYHRSYLFHGEPGTGKTSLIYALAGNLERNLCFIQMDKNMTDDTFRTAMSQLPQMALIVLEDVDALFTNHREADHSWSSLSFSGFLNCLDGLGAPDDVIIFMTTNHPDRLDPAVMRPGRVDVKVSFKSPNKDMASKYFLTFYPEAEQAAKEFGAAIGSRVSERRVSMAQLQHFFLACHRQGLTAEQAGKNIKDFVFEDVHSSKPNLYG